MNLFTYIKERVAMVDIAREYVLLKKAGIYYKGCCPFHQEKDASFTVSPHKEIFYCFGCHATGDVISFISQVEGCNQFEAAQLIIEKYQIDIPEELLKEKKEATLSFDKKNRYFALCEIISEWCVKELQQSPEALNYLESRKIDPAIAQRFKIGFFPAGIQKIKSLQKYIHQKSFLVSDLLEAHIMSEGQNSPYSPFEDRIIFPISDHLGRHCGFGGRIFKPGDERAKYYNSRENSLFNKGALLFGLHQAKKSIQQCESVFIVEGYTDCVAMAQHGYPHTVATLGTACTHTHLKQISHYADQIYVLFDGDSAGLQAMLRLTQLCWDVNIDIRVIQLPSNEDPASYLGSGNDLKKYINKADDIFSFFIHYSTKQFKQQTLKKKMTIVRELLNIINAIDDGLKRTILLQDAALNMNLPFEMLQSECKKSYGALKTEKALVEEKTTITEGEKKFFALLLEQPKLVEREDVIIMLNAFSEPLKTILNKYRLLPEKSFNLLIEKLTIEEKQLTYALSVSHAKEQVVQNSEQTIQAFAQQHWKKITHVTKEKITQAQQMNDPKQVTILLEQLQELKKKILNWGV